MEKEETWGYSLKHTTGLAIGTSSAGTIEKWKMCSSNHIPTVSPSLG